MRLCAFLEYFGLFARCTGINYPMGISVARCLRVQGKGSLEIWKTMAGSVWKRRVLLLFLLLLHKPTPIATRLCVRIAKRPHPLGSRGASPVPDVPDRKRNVRYTSSSQIVSQEQSVLVLRQNESMPSAPASGLQQK